MIIAQYSYNEYGPYDGCKEQHMFMLLNNGIRFVKGLNKYPITYVDNYTSKGTSYLTNFRLEFTY